MKDTFFKRLKETKLFVCDMDGTIYLGDMPIDGAVDFVRQIKEKGKRLLFFTNNASKTAAFYKDKLCRLGFGDCEVVTAGDVTVSYLNAHHKGKRVFLVGTKALEKDMLDAGINLVYDKNADIVVSSFDTELTYEKVNIACDALHAGAVYLCTHPDLNCPLQGGGWLPDSGAIAAMISAATNKTPKYLGKPYAETAMAIERITGISADDCACIGDRLYTDIALGKNSDMLSILVLSGETKAEDISKENSPDLVFDSVFDICHHI